MIKKAFLALSACAMTTLFVVTMKRGAGTKPFRVKRLEGDTPSGLFI